MKRCQWHSGTGDGYFSNCAGQIALYLHIRPQVAIVAHAPAMKGFVEFLPESLLEGAWVDQTIGRWHLGQFAAKGTGSGSFIMPRCPGGRLMA